MSQSIRLSQGGRIVLPVQIRKDLGLEEGDVLVVERNKQGILLTPMSQAIECAQAILVPFKKPNRSIVDEFLHEKNKEVKNE